MPSFSDIASVEAPTSEVSWELREHRSPDGSWVASFRDPFEWHMGATGWRCSVSSSDNGIPISNSALIRLSEGKGAFCPLYYAPWNAESSILALLSWDDGLAFFEPASNAYRKLKEKLPFAAQWSPTIGVLLLASQTQLSLIDETGEASRIIDWRSAENEPPLTGWLPSGDMFFVIGRPSTLSKSRISFFTAVSGEMISAEALDPSTLLPYDEDEFRKIARGRYSLIVSPSTRSVGYLLDVWYRMVFEQATGLLYLSTYRPTGRPVELDGHYTCTVEEKWASIRLHG